LDDLLEKESKRIYKILYKDYKKKVIVNMPIKELISSKIDNKYSNYLDIITKLVLRKVPKYLYLDPSNTYIFLKKEEFYIVYNSCHKKTR